MNDNVEISVEEIQSLLQMENPLIPELLTADVSVLRKQDIAREVIEEALKGKLPPSLTWTMLRDDRISGTYKNYDLLNHKRRDLLYTTALAAWLEPENQSLLDYACDLIWLCCEQTVWAFPTYSLRDPWLIDLRISAMGYVFSVIQLLLGERLPQEIQERMSEEINKRILTNYIERADDFWWANGWHNWTGVCAGCAGICFLVFEKNHERLAAGIAVAIRHLRRYLNHGFANDGGSLEGIGYWFFGLSPFLIFSEMLHAKTNGKLDLCSLPKMKLIAQYPLAINMGGDHYASFADSSSKKLLPKWFVHRITERTGVNQLHALPHSCKKHFLNFLWIKEHIQDELDNEDIFLPESGIIRIVSEISGKRLVLCAKGGFNKEPHNHNDIGSFVLRVGETEYLCDPGAGLYDGAYFSETRYERLFTSSKGHSVPVVDGVYQGFGEQFRGELTKLDGKGFNLDYHKAYPVSNLASLVRTLKIESSSIILEDTFSFIKGSVDVESALITWQNVEIDGDIARIIGKDGVLSIQSEGLPFTLETFEEECRAEEKSGILKRLSIKTNCSEKNVLRFTMKYQAMDDDLNISSDSASTGTNYELFTFGY